MDKLTRLSNELGPFRDHHSGSSLQQSPSPNEEQQASKPSQITYRRKLVIVGSRGCGKTCLLTRFDRKSFPEVYVPSVYESSVVEGTDKTTGRTVELSLWDTSTNDCYERLRPLSYPGSDIVLICFSIDKPESLEDVEEYWLPEIHHFIPKVPRILVGCKADLRQAPQAEKSSLTPNKMVSMQQGQQMAQKLSFNDYIECSAKDDLNVHAVFETAIRTAIAYRRPKKRCQICLIL